MLAICLVASRLLVGRLAFAVMARWQNYHSSLTRTLPVTNVCKHFSGKSLSDQPILSFLRNPYFFSFLNLNSFIQIGTLFPKDQCTIQYFDQIFKWNLPLYSKSLWRLLMFFGVFSLKQLRNIKMISIWRFIQDCFNLFAEDS